MIRGIRRRFIRIALAVLALAMVMVVIIINAANWISVRTELYETIDALVESEGQTARFGDRSRHFRVTLEESRYFVVTEGRGGGLTLKDRSHLAEVENDERIMEIASEALKSGRSTGFCEDYLYAVSEQREGIVAVFLNCETKLARVRGLALISALACGGLILLAWLLVALFSQKAIRPLIENTIRQKQFITDAGHELKTPLTVISANMDVLSLENENNEFIVSGYKFRSEEDAKKTRETAGAAEQTGRKALKRRVWMFYPKLRTRRPGVRIPHGVPIMLRLLT